MLRQFRTIFSAVRGHFRVVEKSAGVAGAQVWALSEIRNKPGLTVNELALAMDVKQSTASNLIRSLKDSDLIRSEQNAQDRRSVQLWINPAGRAVLRRVPPPLKGALPEALNGMDARTLARMRRDLAKLIAILGAEDAGQTLLSDL